MIWDMWKKGFYAWENATAKYMDTVLTSPLTLTPGGAMMSAMMKARARQQELASQWWSATGLPTRHDQERTLHALNQLQSRLMDLEEKIEELK